MLRRTVEVSKLQQLGKIPSAEMSLRKAVKELQEHSSKLAELFRRSLVVALPSLTYAYFTRKAAPKAFARLYYFPCSLAITFADSLQYLPLGEDAKYSGGSFSEQNALLSVLAENYRCCTNETLPYVFTSL